jgi:PHD/YefM family antitoxin component YafN of YafNO toxin-antitoxin module
MATIPVQEVKRRGMVAVDEALAEGPVHLMKNNRAEYVVMSEADYKEMMNDIEEARLAASEMDLKAGRTRKGTAKQLMKTLTEDD